MLRAETGMSLTPNLGINSLETYKYHLRKQQERLYHDHDWPFLNGHYDVEMQAGERYYDLPVHPERIEKVEVKWGGRWAPLPYGIKSEYYNSRDSDLDQRNDPPEGWGFYLDPEGADSTVDNIQFEVWPIPISNDQSTVRFHGKRALPPLTSESHKAILDDLLIVLYAASKIIKDKGEREMKLAEAKAHYTTLKRRSKKGKVFVLGGGGDVSKPPPGPVRVAYTLDSET